MVKKIEAEEDGRAVTIYMNAATMEYITGVAQSKKWSFSQAAREIILAAKDNQIEV
jgi:hypothetical protein